MMLYDDMTRWALFIYVYVALSQYSFLGSSSSSVVGYEERPQKKEDDFCNFT